MEQRNGIAIPMQSTDNSRRVVGWGRGYPVKFPWRPGATVDVGEAAEGAKVQSLTLFHLPSSSCAYFPHIPIVSEAEAFRSR
jgi:hypothetical protein